MFRILIVSLFVAACEANLADSGWADSGWATTSTEGCYNDGIVDCRRGNDAVTEPGWDAECINDYNTGMCDAGCEEFYSPGYEAHYTCEQVYPAR